jgi:transposase-like protein
MARPTKLTEQTQDAIIKALSIGATYKDAAEAAGVDYVTFNNWMIQGEKAKSGKFFEFFYAVKQTEAEARMYYLSVIAKAAPRDWRAALEFLKRRDRANWGDNVDVTTGGEKLRVVIEYANNKDNPTDPA